MKHYNEQYFASQIRKSDAKVHWQYGRIFQLANIQPAGRILDIGCGAGPGLRYLAAKGAHAFGVDIARYSLTEAANMVPSANLVQASVEFTLPFADASMDIVLVSELIEHLWNGRPLLFECVRVVRPGGHIIITTPNLWDIRRYLASLTGQTWSGYTDPTHVNLYTPTRLKDDMISAGFTHIHVRTGIKPMVWMSSQILNVRLPVPYPPLVGNGLLVTGKRES